MKGDDVLARSAVGGPQVSNGAADEFGQMLHVMLKRNDEGSRVAAGSAVGSFAALGMTLLRWG